MSNILQLPLKLICDYHLINLSIRLLDLSHNNKRKSIKFSKTYFFIIDGNFRKS